MSGRGSSRRHGGRPCHYCHQFNVGGEAEGGGERTGQYPRTKSGGSPALTLTISLFFADAPRTSGGGRKDGGSGGRNGGSGRGDKRGLFGVFFFFLAAHSYWARFGSLPLPWEDQRLSQCLLL